MYTIQVLNIENTNANLLVTLDTLLAERSVSRAALRLGITQPATSNALAKLRELFDDPLLVRSGRAMVPTALARRLVDPIRSGVSSFRSALAAIDDFDPFTSTMSVHISASDFLQAVLLPSLLRHLSQEAPHMRVALSHGQHFEDLGSLERGDSELFLGFFGDLPAAYFGHRLFDEHLLAIVRKGHPRVGKRLTLARYLSLEHIVVSESPGSPGAVDIVLAKRKLARKVALHVPHFLQVPMLIAHTDLVAATNSRIAKYFAPRLGLQIHKLPIQAPPATAGMVWHARTHGDPGHAWFRSLVARCQPVEPGPAA